MAFNLGTPKTATGFTLLTNTTVSATTASGGSGDTKAPNKPLTSLFGAAPINSPGGGFFLGGTPKTTAPAVSFGFGSTTAAASTPSFSLTPASAATTPQFSLGSSTTTTTSASSFMPIFATGTSLSAGVSLASTATTAAALKLTSSLTPATTSTTTTSLGLGALTASTQAATSTTTTAAVQPAGSLTYAQLEDSINKWSIDLEEQGKFFINQAKQLNAWDNLLISNSDKILTLNETIERVKQQQKQLDQELDFVLAQQKELDESSLQLEKQLADIPVTDQNRFQTYQLAEIIDSQLKQMSEDLKEIVEHLNESNKNEDVTDPVIQVSRILNAHMNSLQWIDRNTSQISSHLEQIANLHDTYKKNHMNL